jgi:hypothetical protein
MLPQIFCWTRFGTEAGEPIEQIIERKEAERRANGGVFFWGIGNSVSAGIVELVRRCERPELLFSPITSRPRRADVTPSRIALWTAGEAANGERLLLPPAVRVTSRHDPSSKRGHYALVCASEQPLALADLGRLDFGTLTNLLSGNPVGASQVTAVVSRSDELVAAGKEYLVALRVALCAPYFIRLHEPILLGD